MADIEKVIRGWKRCSKGTCPSYLSKEYAECEYTIGPYCGQDRLIADTLELLKDQDNQIYNMRLIIEEYEKELQRK